MLNEKRNAEDNLNKAIINKYQINNENKLDLKDEYRNKEYTQKDREQLINLVKFYAEWLYGPVDEDLENKLYFLEDSSLTVENYFYEELKKTENILGNKNSSTSFYGLKKM